MTGERAVVIDGAEPLFAVLHEPEHPREPRVGVSLLNPGLKNRVAPNRLNVRLARRLAAAGYFVLRLDPPGIGDSGGELPEHALPDLWQFIQRGGLVGPVIEAHRVFRDTCGLSEIVGMGNCGGAITALLACFNDASCARLVLIDVPVTLRGDDEPGSWIVSRQHGAWVLSAYARRIADWRAWVRIITLKSDMRTIGTALRARFLNKAKPLAPAAAPAEGPQSDAGEGERLNELFLDAFRSFEARSGRIFFVTAGQDVNTIQFDTMFASTYLDSPGASTKHRRLTIKDANHIYGLPEWRDALVGSVADWLEATGPAARGEVS
jgi:pimeloyl-ACP methyl ester carboxylesterase